MPRVSKDWTEGRGPISKGASRLYRLFGNSISQQLAILAACASRLAPKRLAVVV